MTDYKKLAHSIAMDQSDTKAVVPFAILALVDVLEKKDAAVVEEENSRTMSLVIEMLNEWGHQAASELLEMNRDLFKKEEQ